MACRTSFTLSIQNERLQSSRRSQTSPSAIMFSRYSKSTRPRSSSLSSGTVSNASLSSGSGYQPVGTTVIKPEARPPIGSEKAVQYSNPSNSGMAAQNATMGPAGVLRTIFLPFLGAVSIGRYRNGSSLKVRPKGYTPLETFASQSADWSGFVTNGVQRSATCGIGVRRGLRGVHQLAQFVGSISESTIRPANR